MAFTDQQARLLKAKLDAQYVKTRKANGATLHYIELARYCRANRIFGDAWDRRTPPPSASDRNFGAVYLAAYTAKVRIRVRAGDVTVVREGSGTGEGRLPRRASARDRPETAETDATKRALATFGNVFGLPLRPRTSGVRQHKAKPVSAHSRPRDRGSCAQILGQKNSHCRDFLRSLREP
jgi:recombination DNA repair RAD52 pathway protein